MGDPVQHLLIPGLLGPLPGAAQAGQGVATPTLARWLARADASAVPVDVHALLFRLHGLPLPPTDSDLPTAPLCWLADSGEVPLGVVYHADPVHLRPDQDRLLLFDAPAADLTAEEDAALLDTLNAHLREDGWRLAAPAPGRWYLHLDAPPALTTRPLGAVIGRNVDLFLPGGADARAVRARLTEVQMLLHDHPVNVARQAAGRSTVSGLWLHGGGSLPQGPTTRFALDDDAPALLRGLQRLAAGPEIGRLRWLGDARRAVWDADPAAWWRAAVEAEACLRTAPAADTVLYPGDGQAYRWTAASRWRWWRRAAPLTARLLPQDQD